MAFEYFPKLYVRTKSNVEFSTETFPLAFAVPYAETKDSRKRQHTVDSWANIKTYDYDKQCYVGFDDTGPHILDNVPLDGFTFGKTISRWSTSNKFVEIYDPRGFKLQLNIDNVVYLLHNTTISDGKIQEKLVWARQGGNYLVLEEDAISIKEQKSGGLVPGDKINGLIYVGQYFVASLNKEHKQTFKPAGRWQYSYHHREILDSWYELSLAKESKKLFVFYNEEYEQFMIYKSQPKYYSKTSNHEVPDLNFGEISREIKFVSSNYRNYANALFSTKDTLIAFEPSVDEIFASIDEYYRKSADLIYNGERRIKDSVDKF